MAETKIELFGVEITEPDAIAFMESFGPAEPCPVCKTNVWSVNLTPPSEVAEILSLRTADVTGKLGANSYPIYLAVCHTCGHIRSQSCYQMAMWVKSRKEAAPDDNS